MITPEQYVGVVAERIQRGGGRLNSVQLGPAIAAVGLFTERTCRAPWIGTPPRSSSPPEIYAQLQWQVQQQAPPPPPGWEPQVPPQPAPPPPPYGY